MLILRKLLTLLKVFTRPKKSRIKGASSTFRASRGEPVPSCDLTPTADSYSAAPGDSEEEHSGLAVKENELEEKELAEKSEESAYSLAKQGGLPEDKDSGSDPDLPLGSSKASESSTDPEASLNAPRQRISVVKIMVALMFSILIVKVTYETILGLLTTRSGGLKTSYTSLLIRHDILDRHGNVLALTVPANSVYLRPKEIIQPKLAVRALVQSFHIKPIEALAMVNSTSGFVWVARNVSNKALNKFLRFGVVGAHIDKGYRRFYPYGSYFSHVVGITNIDGKGISGAEYYFNSDLLNHNVTLSLDVRLQTILHNALAHALERDQAKRAFGIIINPKTGEVLALSSVPDFDPNNRNTLALGSMFNYVTQGEYEQGSTFKLFTVAIALDQNTITPANTFDVSKPMVKDGHVFVDDTYLSRAINVPEVLMYSSDIGSALIAKDISLDTQKKYFSYLGLFNSSTLELPEKEESVLPTSWTELTKTTLSYGYGMAVSQATAVNAFMSLFNGGYYAPLTLIKLDPNLKIKKLQVFKPETSLLMRRLGRLVMAQGTGRSADVPGYNVGGKTGTAELLDHSSGHYDMHKVLSSVLAYFPAEDPKYLMLLSVEQPTGSKKTHWSRVAAYTIAPEVKVVVGSIAALFAMPAQPDGARSLKRNDSRQLLDFVRHKPRATIESIITQHTN